MTYTEFIQKCKNRIIPQNTYTEIHHIKPKCIGGNDDPDNLIKLTGIEHYNAHKILSEENPDNIKLQIAWYFMACGPKHYQEGKILFTAEEYARLRELSVIRQKAATEARLKKLEEQRKIKEANKTTKIDLRLRGHKHTKEFKEMMSKKYKGRPITWEIGKYERTPEQREKARQQQKINFSKPVLCVETGVVFPTRKEAGLAVGCPQQNISRAITYPTRTAGGYHWKEATHNTISE